MNAGLEVYTPTGVLKFSTFDRVGRVLGSLFTGTNNGAVSHAELANGMPFAHLVPIGSVFDGSLSIPEVVIVGTTVTWTFGEGDVDRGAVRANSLLVFGVC